MPSDAYVTFLHLMEDVSELTTAHYSLSQGKRGRKRLGFLTRSAVVMLCAAWERYNEDLLLEGIKIISNNLTDAHLLPKEVKKVISSLVKRDKDEIKPIELSGFGWKTLWENYARAETELLNTPKSEKLSTLFERYLGLPNYTNLWVKNSFQKIDKFVVIRGDIAHKGNQAKYTKMRQLQSYIEMVISNTIEIDSNVAKFLKNHVKMHELPWELDYQRTLGSYKDYIKLRKNFKPLQIINA